MFNDVLTIWGCILNVVGTIFAVLCILKMSIKDVLYTRTAYGLDNAEFGVLEQIYHARVGIGIIFLGAIVQVVAIIFKNITLQCMLSLCFISVFILILWVIEEKKRYLRNSKKVREQVKLST